MERSPTAYRPQAPIVADLDVGRMLSFLTMFAMPRPATSSRQEPWHSYAVYSGALSPRHHKSSGRFA